MAQHTAISAQGASAASRSPGAITRRPQARHGLDSAGATLYSGMTVIPLDTVASYAAEGLSEKDLSTAFATIAIFSGVAAFQIFGVVEIGWRAKFLLEGALFGAIALCAVAELFSAMRQTLYTFTIVQTDGTRTEFVTTDKSEAEAVKTALDRALGA